MKVFETIESYREWRGSLKGQSVGFVPTMGALHIGHASLLDRARKENDITVLSIFVNPTQFNQKEDFEKYPKTWEQDLEIARAHQVDAVFAPKDPRTLYPDDYRYQVSEKQFSKSLCGEFRPGHFEGVLTVVLKLLQVVKADRAYFGEKDYQQLSLIDGMARAFFLDVKIIPCETVREPTGLALSSRNLRLSPSEKEIAPGLYRVMTEEADLETAKKELAQLGFKVEYLVDQEFETGVRRFAAAWLGNVRLIDNVKR